jgi:hypothetical protein
MGNLNDSANEDKVIHADQIQYPKKEAKDYFFDFFMLFLAVTLGFFVNNLSENQSERQRENQYMKSLVNDLASDTTQIGEIHTSINSQIRGIDTLMQILENRDQKYFINNLYYYSFKYLNSANFFTGSDRTISQLKSAGGLRLIQKKGESDKIVQYYSSVENVKYNTEFCLKEFYRISDFEKELFNFGVLRIKGLTTDSLRRSKNLKLLTNEPLKIDYFYNQILLYTSALINYKQLTADLKKEADSLLVFTKQSYKID